MRNQKGFSLVELLIVVAIIGIIAAIAIPSLLSARRAANEASAIGSLRTMGSAEATALSLNGTYQTLAIMSANKYIDATWATTAGKTRDNYTFADAGTPDTGTFGVTSAFQTGGGTRSFGIYEDYVVRAATSSTPPDRTGTPVGVVASGS